MYGLTRVFICLFLAMVGGNLRGQVICKPYIIEDNKTTIPDSIKNLNHRSVLIFCPMYGMNVMDSLAYIHRCEELCMSDSLVNLGQLHLYFFYFKEDPKDNGNGIHISNKNNTRGINVSQQTVFLVNFDRKLIYRACNQLDHNIEAKEPFDNESFFRIAWVEGKGKQCFRTIQERIPAYEDYIQESLRPRYTTEERLQQLQYQVQALGDSVVQIQQSTIELKRQNEGLQTKFDSIKQILNQFFLNKK